MRYETASHNTCQTSVTHLVTHLVRPRKQGFHQEAYGLSGLVHEEAHPSKIGLLTLSCPDRHPLRELVVFFQTGFRGSRGQ